MKTIIERQLNLKLKYIIVDKKYIPIEQSAGAYCCDNCGKLIANIATVKDEHGESFDIGFDCLETILINNNLLSNGDIQEYERVKKLIPKVLRFAKQLKETLVNNSRLNITGFKFEKQTYKSDWFPFYYLKDGSLISRDNDIVKLKEMDFDFLLTTLKNIFPNLTIITD